MTREKSWKIITVKKSENTLYMTWKTSFLFSRRDLVNQESRYNAQLEAAAQKVNELKSQINDLERDISNKSGVQERKYDKEPAKFKNK